MRLVVKAILHFLMRIFFRIKIYGKENIPEKGGYILCGNHVHALDAVAIVLTAKRKIRFLAKAELYNNKIIAFLGKTFEVIPVKRGTADLDAMKACIKAVKNEDILGIFPEGTRNGMAKQSSIKEGAAFIALKTKAQVIPVGITGTFKIFSKITIRYGKPMDFSKYIPEKGKPDKEALDEVSSSIMDEIIRLRDIKE